MFQSQNERKKEREERRSNTHKTILKKLSVIAATRKITSRHVAYIRMDIGKVSNFISRLQEKLLQDMLST